MPKIFNGKDRTFFFANYEGQRRKAAGNVFHTVPTDLERMGDFSQTKTASGVTRLVYDPATMRPDPNRPGFFLRDAFPGNRIPMNRMIPQPWLRRIPIPGPTPPEWPSPANRTSSCRMPIRRPQDRIEFKIRSGDPLAGCSSL